MVKTAEWSIHFSRWKVSFKTKDRKKTKHIHYTIALVAKHWEQLKGNLLIKTLSQSNIFVYTNKSNE